jgi:PAS domain S-box-containing protein
MSGKEETREAMPAAVSRKPRRWRYTVPTAVLALGIVASVATFAAIRQQERSRICNDLALVSQDRVSVLKNIFSLDFAQMRCVRAFFDSTEEVDLKKFAACVQPVLQDCPTIQVVEWVPRVPSSQRPKLEEAERHKTLRGFKITEYDQRGDRVPASPRDEYYPVLLATPAGRSITAVGFDLGTNRAYREAMNRARDSGSLTVTSAIRLSREVDDQRGIRVFVPVYRRHASLKTVEQRRDGLVGFLVGVVRVRDLIERWLANFAPAGIDVQFIDSTDADMPRVLHTHVSRLSHLGPGTTAEEAFGRSEIGFSQDLDVGGRRWTVACSPAPAFSAMRTSWYPWGIAVSELALTILATVYLIGVSNQGARAVRFAEELAERDRRLEQEIAERKKAESSLRESQAKYRAVYDLSAEAIMLLTPEEGFVAGNGATVAMYGCHSEEEFTAHGPADFSPKYQPDGSLSSTKAQQMMAIAMEEGSNVFPWTHKRLDGTEFITTVALTRMELEGKCFLQAIVRDISEQERTQEALRTGQERLRLFIENVSDVVWTMDFSGRFTYMSPSMQQMLGHKWEEDRQLTIAEIMTPSSLTVFLKTLKSIVTEAYTTQRVKTRVQELELIREDGSTVWSELTINGLRNESGEIAAIQGIARDISDRKTAEERQTRMLKRLEAVNHLQEAMFLPASLPEKLRKITQTTVDLLDLDFCRIWMVQPGDLCKHGCIHAGSEGESLTCPHRESCLHLMASSGRYTHITGDHRRVPIGCYKIGRIASAEENKFLTNDVTHDPRVHNHEWAKDLGLVSFGGYKLRDADNNPIGVFAMFAKHPISEEDDVFLSGLAEMTSRVIIEDQTADVISRENAKLSAMISGMEEGVAFADADDVIVEANEYLCRFLGTPRKQIIGKRVGDIHGSEICDLVSAQLGRFRAKVGCDPFVLQRPLHGVEVILRLQPIYRNSQYDGVLLNVVDVSELVKSRHQAEAANQAKSRFLANMSHEIRTPMTAILGYADLLMDPSINASSQNNYAAVIRRNGEHLLSLINDILDLSKIEAGKLTLDMRRCNMVALLADVASVVRPRAEQRGISLSVEYPGVLPETILTDGPRLRQAVINLVGNAVKFTKKGGVRVVTSFLPDFCGDQPAVRIEVIDTGIGIRPQVLPQLFQPFAQAEASIHKEFGGTGLGLAISHQIAHLLGGELTVVSKLGEGSTFTMTVPTGHLTGVRMIDRPAEIEEDAAAHVYAPQSRELSGMRILLAEDGYDNRELIRSVLRKAGAQVECAENGRVAVTKAEVGTFDVVLMDMNMPEMDGYDATRLLRDRGYAQPIVALTANAMSDDSQRCREAGCSEYLSKPIDRAKLVALLARYASETAVAGALPPAAPPAVPPPAEKPPEDTDTVVSQFSNDPEMATILGEFIGRLDGQVEAMRQAYRDRQYEELQRLGHRLKGAGGSYGFPSLTNAGKQIEDAVKAKDYSAANAAIERMASLCRAIQRGYAPNALAGRSEP